jgi:hypothetical protein
MKAADLAALAALAEARRTRDLARLEALIAEARGLEAEIVELAATERRDAAAGPTDFAQMGRRHAWAEAQIAARQRRIAGIAAEIAAVRKAARVSLGKHEVLKALVAQAEADERALRSRSEEIAAAAAGRPRQS